MIPPIVIPALFSLAGHGLSEHAEKRVWTGAMARRAQRAVENRGNHVTRTGKARPHMRAGKVVRQNPLPPGRYWIDVFPDGLPSWIGWSGGNLATVSIEKTEVYEGTSLLVQGLGWIYPWVPTPTNPDKVQQPDRAFVIFSVTAPTMWTISETNGWPAPAPKGVVETSDDTVQKPKGKGLFDDISPGVKITVGGIALLSVAVLAGYAVRSFR